MNRKKRGWIWLAVIVPAALAGYVGVATFTEGRFPREGTIFVASLGSVIVMEATLGLSALASRVLRRVTRR